ncbi:MAG: glycosyltransferase family 2 protein [Flavobacteriales bacterium]
MSQRTHISVVVPVFNEQGNIDVLIERINSSLMKVESENFEIILVDDGSTDDTANRIKAATVKHNHIKAILLSRNFGHQIALTAGIQHASGELVVTLDGDLQHPPELIPALIEKAKEGFDIVNTIRLETEGEGATKKITSKGFYRIINRLSDVKIVEGAADFRLMTRKAVDAFLQLNEKDRFTRGLVSWMGFNQAFIPYEAAKRNAGKSKYTLSKMMRFALDGVTSFSSKPLRISFYLGLITSLFALIYAAYAITNHFLGETMPGWTSILVVVLFLGGIQLISIGIIGEYLARVYNESKARPLYFIKEKIGSFKDNS